MCARALCLIGAFDASACTWRAAPVDRSDQWAAWVAIVVAGIWCCAPHHSGSCVCVCVLHHFTAAAHFSHLIIIFNGIATPGSLIFWSYNIFSATLLLFIGDLSCGSSRATAQLRYEPYRQLQIEDRLQQTWKGTSEKWSMCVCVTPLDNKQKSKRIYYIRKWPEMER